MREPGSIEALHHCSSRALVDRCAALRSVQASAAVDCMHTGGVVAIGCAAQCSGVQHRTSGAKALCEAPGAEHAGAGAARDARPRGALGAAIAAEVAGRVSPGCSHLDGNAWNAWNDATVGDHSRKGAFERVIRVEIGLDCCDVRDLPLSPPAEAGSATKADVPGVPGVPGVQAGQSASGGAQSCTTDIHSLVHTVPLMPVGRCPALDMPW